MANKLRRLSRRTRERVHGIPLRIAAGKAGRPIPPGRLIFLVANTEDVSWYLDTGALAANNIRAILAANGYDVEKFGAILDFGCGVGRAIRHWDRLDGTEVHGTDYNPDLVRWCRKRLPFARYTVNQLMKPLPYADQKFDLIYCLSVFTHLGEETQRFWMDELSRVLAPGGLLLITTHGDHYVPMLDDAERSAYRDGQLVVRKSRRQGSNDCSAFHPESYVRAVLAAGFDVVEMRPEGALGNPCQDLYLLKKKLSTRLNWSKQGVVS